MFLFQLSAAQTVNERNTIKNSYNKERVNELKSELSDSHKEQQKRIISYKLKSKLIESEKYSLQRIYNGLPIFYTIDNDESVVSIRANSLQPNGDLQLNLTGSGIIAGVWDGGKVRDTHQELSGSKIIFGDGATSFSAHSTHVTGTICATGFLPRARGFAYGARANTYFWDNDLSEMASFGSEGFLMSNHSYGYNVTNLPKSRFGYYDQTSADFDKIAEVFPYYQIVVAAGNSRNTQHPQIIAKGGFDMLTGSAVSKNIIVVAAVHSVPIYNGPGSVRMSSFSNYGPTDDGRIKPDISAKGVDVYSCNFLSDTHYESLSGTSMAAPAITGLIVLLQEHYKNLNRVFMKAATVRGLLCHTADEAGASKGPDYEYGWGLANGKEAAKLISSNGSTALIQETNLNNNVTFSKQVVISSEQSLSVSIAWTDPAGIVTALSEDNRTAKLINDLDLKVIDQNGIVYYPWKLNPAETFNPATQNSENNVDNIEKVFIENAPAGTYTIQVTNKGALVGGGQDFTLIANAGSGLTLSRKGNEVEKSLLLYPNPIDDKVYFDIPSTFMLSKIEIYDINGNKIKSFKYNLINFLDLTDLSSGLYIIRYVTEDNKVHEAKFLKK